MKRLIQLIFIACIYSVQFAQPISLMEREILQLQDQRSLGEGKLLFYLKDKDAQLRYRSAIALANIQNYSAIEPLSLSLKDSNNNVRAASAFALGQIGTGKADTVLLTAVFNERDQIVLGRILEALGKCGSPHTLDLIINFSEEKPDYFPPKDLALCIARFALRQIRSERSIWKCFELAVDTSQDVCAAALYALWWSAPNGLIDLEISKQKEELVQLIKAKNFFIRMNLATLLGRTKSSDAKEILDSLEKSETDINDWHVWVQIVRVRAALSVADKKVIAKYSEYLVMKNDHIKISALQAFTAIPSEIVMQSDIVDSLRQTICRLASDSSGENETVRGEAFVVLGKHFPSELDRFQVWIANTKAHPRFKAKLLEGIAQRTTHEHLNILLAHLDNENTRLSMAAWDFIRGMLSPAALRDMGFDSTAVKSMILNIYQKSINALAKEDIGITTVISELFADTSVFKNFRDAGLTDRIVDEMIESYKNLNNPDDVETKQAILGALGSINVARAVPFLEKVLSDPVQVLAAEANASLKIITGKNYSEKQQHVVPIYTEEDWKLLESITPHQHVQMMTDRGEIILELLKEDAPFTVLNFTKLIKKNFYDSLYFHRVVPDFVVQGGDPRGDGWGGPGYTMRTEVSLINYEEGSCGMASAGRDTEGCQFFITYIPVPHLDGRYTIFARVVKGMDIADKLQIGDSIRFVRLMQ